MIARNSIVIMLSQASCAILGMFGLFTISKLWGHNAPGIMGVVWFGFSFVGTFSFITNLGFDAAHVKKVSEGRDIGKCNGTYIAIKLMLTGIFVACVVSSLLIWKFVQNGQLYDTTRESVIYVFVAYYAILSLAQIPTMTFNSLKKNAKSQLALFMDPLCRVVLFIFIALAGISGALVVTDSGQSIVDIPARYSWPSALQPLQAFLANHTIGTLSFAYVFGALAMLLAGFIMFRKYPVSRPDREYMSAYLKFAAPLAIPVVFSLVNAYLDKVILGYYWTSVEVGYYFAVQRISSFVMLVPAAIGIVLFPTVSAIHSKYRNRAAVRRRKISSIIKASARYTSMFTIPIVFFTIVLSIPLIDIFLNSSFRPGSDSLRILALYTYVSTMLIPYHFLILGSGKPGLTAKVFVVSGLSNIALNLLFIPRNGLLAPLNITGPTGAATATLISAIILFLGLYIYSKKLMRRPLFEGRLLQHMFAGALAASAMWWLAGLPDALRVHHVAILGLVGLGAYLGVLFALGEFRKKELRFFLDTVNPLGLFRYVKDEVIGKRAGGA